MQEEIGHLLWYIGGFGLAELLFEYSFFPTKIDMVFEFIFIVYLCSSTEIN